jgi:hypothetical protein
VEKAASELSDMIKETPIPPELVSINIRSPHPLAKLLLNTIDMFDKLLTGSKGAVLFVYQQLETLDAFLGVKKPRTMTDFLFVKGSLGTARNDLCTAVLNYGKQVLRLRNHRDNWAKALGRSSSHISILPEFEKYCPNDVWMGTQ